jgi:glutamine phosphoribosylpyrophosphate amidotransferase
MISLVVLQNGLNLGEGERGSSSDTCVISTVDGNHVSGIEAERVSSVTRRGSRVNDNSRNKDRTQGKWCAFQRIYYACLFLCFCAACCSWNKHIFNFLNIYF